MKKLVFLTFIAISFSLIAENSEKDILKADNSFLPSKDDFVIGRGSRIRSEHYSMWQVNLNVSSVAFVSSAKNIYTDIEFLYKRNLIMNALYLNIGFSVGTNSLTGGGEKTGNIPFNYKAFTFGIPVSLELSWMDNHKTSVYGNIGIRPSFYNTTSIESPDGEGNQFGFAPAIPHLECGVHIAIGEYHLRIGIFGERFMTFKDEDVHKRLGRRYLGGGIGLIF
ncbi:MAG: hypothetical protein IJ748_07055 [Bacteroidales bacterium]|nr:hypothetical protein [Bacteroidales bacterium]